VHCKRASGRSCCSSKRVVHARFHLLTTETGELHLAFAIRPSELAKWEAWLAESGISIEEKRVWERGGESIYFRDLDRHLIELATPGVWSVY
jgi:catechol 2,3-dioxygenase-like lactoylglutathione lyase family enzyme